MNDAAGGAPRRGPAPPAAPRRWPAPRAVRHWSLEASPAVRPATYSETMKSWPRCPRARGRLRCSDGRARRRRALRGAAARAACRRRCLADEGSFSVTGRPSSCRPRGRHDAHPALAERALNAVRADHLAAGIAGGSRRGGARPTAVPASPRNPPARSARRGALHLRLQCVVARHAPSRNDSRSERGRCCASSNNAATRDQRSGVSVMRHPAHGSRAGPGASQLAVQPGPGHRPRALDGGGGEAHRRRRFLDRHPAEVAQLDHAGMALVEAGQSLERLVEREHVDRRRRHGRDEVVQGEPHGATAPLARGACARVLDQDLPHRMGGDAEEMRAVLERQRRVLEQPQIRLVHERGRLERARPVSRAASRARRSGAVRRTRGETPRRRPPGCPHPPSRAAG